MILDHEDFKAYDKVCTSKIFRLFINEKRRKIQNTSGLRLIKENDEQVIFRLLNPLVQMDYLKFREELAKIHQIEI